MMNDRITLLKPAAGVDSHGQPNAGFDDMGTVWGNMRFPTGAEVLRSGAETSIKRASVRLRARKDIDTSWRLRYQGEDFEIKGPPLPDKDRAFMFVVCEAVR
jgi:SPP1 family predicted phage head-tail adaptor